MLPIGEGLRLADAPTSEAVRLSWDPVPDAVSYSVYRSLFDVGSDRALGLPLVDLFGNDAVHFEDRLDLTPRTYHYSVLAHGADGAELDFRTLEVEVSRVITADQAVERGLIDSAAEVEIGDEVLMPLHPFGTDYLGRDMLARLMHGARVSLFIGIAAPLLYVLFGVIYGSTAGFIGGRIDQTLMRFADFVVALPFLLFMILFKIAFGIGPGESGILPMLVALVLLSWPATSRLVRGQILQIREEGYINASRLLGAKKRLPGAPAHDPEHHGRDPGYPDLRRAERDLHGGLPLVHRHGGRTANAQLGQHVQRRHQDHAHHAPRAHLPGPVHQHHGAGVQPAG